MVRRRPSCFRVVPLDWLLREKNCTIVLLTRQSLERSKSGGLFAEYPIRGKARIIVGKKLFIALIINYVNEIDAVHLGAVPFKVSLECVYCCN